MFKRGILYHWIIVYSFLYFNVDTKYLSFVWKKKFYKKKFAKAKQDILGLILIGLNLTHILSEGLLTLRKDMNEAEIVSVDFTNICTFG